MENSLLKGNNSILISQTSDISSQSNFDFFQTPPNFFLAKNHGNAKKIGLIDDSDIDKCMCCNIPTKKTNIPLCISRKNLSEFGYIYYLYFELIFFGAILLIFVFLNSSIENFF